MRYLLRRFHRYLAFCVQAQVEELEQKIAEKQAHLAHKRGEYMNLQQQQRTLVLDALEVSSKMMHVGTEAMRAAKQEAAVGQASSEEKSDTRVRLAKKFTMFETPIVPPRPLHSFQHFASICYNCLLYTSPSPRD